MIDIWKSKPNNGLPSEVIFMDLSKPFDSSNHNLLLVKLNVYGPGESASGFIKSYLINKTQEF